MFELSVKGDFASAHFLRGYEGKCKTLHGHTWKVELTIESDKLDKIGMVADFALVKAWKGDSMGNLVFRGTARNFNPNVATASYHTIAEVEQLVPLGQINPDDVHIPGIFVKTIFEGKNYQKRIEKRMVREC